MTPPPSHWHSGKFLFRRDPGSLKIQALWKSRSTPHGSIHIIDNHVCIYIYMSVNTIYIQYHLSQQVAAFLEAPF